MTLCMIQSASGQISPSSVGGAADRQAVAEMIDGVLKQSAQKTDIAEQITDLQGASNQILRHCPKNVVVVRMMKNAVSQAAESKDQRQALALLRAGLREIKATLEFKPLIEAPLPEGFPEPTPVGEFQIKQYPAYRLARTRMSGVESGAFWTLFSHIKKKDIAMTAPVEMAYGETVKKELQPKTMAFLYRSTAQGQAGTEQDVEVVDVPAMTALSLGVRGEATKARLVQAKTHLDAWLAEHTGEYEASGPLRVMGYNSPFVAANRRFTEVEIPLRRILPAR